MILSENTLKTQNLKEFESLLKEFIAIKPSKFIEIGSLYGWTLEHFIHYASRGSTAVSIDLPVRKFVGPDDPRVLTQEDRYKNVWPTWAKTHDCKLYLINGMSQQESTLTKVKDIFNNEPVDFLFIDGNHMYDAVKRDFEMYSPLVRKGGIVALHDIGKNEEGGVFVYWNEIKQKYKTTEFLHDPNHVYGIGVVYID